MWTENTGFSRYSGGRKQKRCELHEGRDCCRKRHCNGNRKNGHGAAGVLKDATLDVGWNTTNVAGDTAEGMAETIGNVSSKAKDVVADTTRGLVNIAVGAGQKGARYVAGKTTAEYAGKAAGTTMGLAKTVVGEGKDVALETGRTTAEYAGNAAGVVRDVGLVAGWNAAEFASDAATGVVDTVGQAKDVVTEKTTGLIDTAVDLEEKGASYVRETAVRGKDITLEVGTRTAEYAGKAAGVLKDATLDVGWNTTKFAGDTAVGMAEMVGNVSREVGKAGWNAAEYVGDKAMGATETMGDKCDERCNSRRRIEHGNIAGDTAEGTTMGLKKTMVGEGKDVALETWRTTVDYAGNTAGVVRDVGLVAGWNAAEFASDAATGVVDTVGQAKDVVTKKTTGLIDTAVDLEEKGASYVGETVVRGKDITLEAGTRTAKYVGKAAGVLKDAALDVGWNTTKFAGDTVVGMAETVGNVSREVGKVGWNAAEYVGDKAMGVTETMGNMTRGAAGLIGDIAVATKDVLSSVGTKTGEMIASAEERAARNLA
nr:hypothetical protein [Tanacetum cinerariifolium]